jgi:hypothetical protein
MLASRILGKKNIPELQASPQFNPGSNMSFLSFPSSIFSARRPLSALPEASQAPKILPFDVLIDEETHPEYNSEIYYPANPDDILDGRFELKTKLGWGTTSTVWLAKDVRR